MNPVNNNANGLPAGGHTSELCQIETAPKAGYLRRPGFAYYPLRFAQALASDQLRTTLARAAVRVWSRASGKPVQQPARKAARPEEVVLVLLPGELVEVKSHAEILATLDEKGAYHGLTFTPEMIPYCGKQYRVFKRLELMFDEYHRSQRRIKNTVLLEGVVCHGAGLGCDRCCFLYWREIWLHRVEPPVVPLA